jgi:hypothetical protein
VAPPGNQAANRENKHHPEATGARSTESGVMPAGKRREAGARDSPPIGGRTSDDGWAASFAMSERLPRRNTWMGPPPDSIADYKDRLRDLPRTAGQVVWSVDSTRSCSFALKSTVLWRAVCGKTACTVRREGAVNARPYPYQGRPFGVRKLACALCRDCCQRHRNEQSPGVGLTRATQAKTLRSIEDWSLNFYMRV